MSGVMSGVSECIEVREHDLLVAGDRKDSWKPNVTALPEGTLDALQTVLLDPRYELNPVATATRFEGRAALKLGPWVGVLRLPDGTAVEILPKTHERPGERARPGSLERSRALLLRMLAATDERFRVAPPAELQTAQMPLYEIVIRYALEGIRAAVRRGVPHTYVPVQEERSGLRGRLDLPRQVRQPPHRAHLLHVTFDEFLPDRPEARLTRLSVERLASLTRVAASQRLARELLHALDDVPPSQNIPLDFAGWRLGRGHPHFAPLESLCRMVLYELNPVVAGAQAQANALLFNMNAVFEAYVAGLLRSQHPEWHVDTQVTGHSLGSAAGQPVFDLRPDLILHISGQQAIVADTKWKRLRPENAPAYDVSNEDAYQMLAYSEVFQRDLALSATAKDLWLIYPRLPGLPDVSVPIRLAGGATLRIITVDLEHADPERQWPAQLDIEPLISFSP